MEQKRKRERENRERGKKELPHALISYPTEVTVSLLLEDKFEKGIISGCVGERGRESLVVEL
jgi:hypothetical protein